VAHVDLVLADKGHKLFRSETVGGRFRESDRGRIVQPGQSQFREEGVELVHGSSWSWLRSRMRAWACKESIWTTSSPSCAKLPTARSRQSPRCTARPQAERTALRQEALGPCAAVGAEQAAALAQVVGAAFDDDALVTVDVGVRGGEAAPFGPRMHGDGVTTTDAGN